MASVVGKWLMVVVVITMAMGSSAGPCGLGIYWGQNNDDGEGTLQKTCDSGSNFTYVALAFLTTFGSGRNPVLNLAGHCNPSSGTCRSLSSQISHCQGKGIKVLLSIGGSVGNYSLSSPEDAREVAYYLWNAYLGGTEYSSSRRPLGDVPLDGVDFAIETPDDNKYWDVLARDLAAYRSQGRVFLSAAPQCPYGRYSNLDAAVKTGLFDIVSVEFYNNPLCDIRAGVAEIVTTWKEWNSSVAVGGRTQFLLGLGAAEDPNIKGFIPAKQLENEVLPKITSGSNYGGVMLWDRFHDLNSGYSSEIRRYVCPVSTQRLIRLPTASDF